MDETLTQIAAAILDEHVEVTCADSEERIVVAHTFDHSKQDMSETWLGLIELLLAIRPDLRDHPEWSMNVFCKDGLLEFPEPQVTT